MSEFFISYSHANKPLCENLVARIKEVHGEDSVWYDPNIPGGSDWWENIVSEIKKCEFFIYLMSDSSNMSQYCQAELKEAIQRSKKTTSNNNYPFDYQISGRSALGYSAKAR